MRSWGEEQSPQSSASLILALLWKFTQPLLAQVLCIYVLQAPARTVLLSGSLSLRPPTVPFPNLLFNQVGKAQVGSETVPGTAAAQAWVWCPLFPESQELGHIYTQAQICKAEPGLVLVPGGSNLGSPSVENIPVGLLSSRGC